MITEREHAECVRLLTKLTNKEIQDKWSWVFMQPVTGLADYADVIKKPMDLGTVRKNLGTKPSRCRFKSHEKFARDVRLVFQNALTYNEADKGIKGSVYDAAQYLLNLFETEYAKSLDSVLKEEDGRKQDASAAGESEAAGASEDRREKRKKHKKDKKSRHRQPPPEEAPATVEKKSMSEKEKKDCMSVLMKVIKYRDGNASPALPFLQPVDLNYFPDYRVKVPRRMHLYGVQKKLTNGGYVDLDSFAFDVRLVFSNCLVYNSDVVVSQTMRSHALKLMKVFEVELAKIGGSWPGIRKRWECQSVLDAILGVRTDGQETAQWFKYPIETYYDSPDQIPYGYYDKVTEPMDLGTVSTRLHLGQYRSARQFVNDTRLTFDNCIRYWRDIPGGQTYCDSAKTLIRKLKEETAKRFDETLVEKASKKARHASTLSSASSSSSSASHKPEAREEKGKSSMDKMSWRDACREVVGMLKKHKMKGYQGVDIRTAAPFEQAVDVSKYSDYLTIVQEPMDLATIDKKLRNERYHSVDEFSADVHLIFSNCLKYNSDPVQCADIRAMATSLRDYFSKLYDTRLAHRANSTGPTTLPEQTADKSKPTEDRPVEKEKPPAPVADKAEEKDAKARERAERKRRKQEKRERKKEKKEKDKRERERQKKEEEAKSAPVKVEPKVEVKAQAPPPPKAEAPPKVEAPPKTEAPLKAEQPPPAAPAPSRVATKSGKSRPSGVNSSRKTSKKSGKKTDLSKWESASKRILDRLKKIDEVGKLHFDKPLVEAFPQLMDEYARFVSEPMDLRTLGEQLEAHSLSPEEFVRKGKLIFENAVTFNSADDEASEHVRNMSKHLEWYFTSLCAEHQPQLFPESEEYKEKRRQLRQEREKQVADVDVEAKTRECHRVLRALTSQKNEKKCWPFRKPVQELFPGLSKDYFDMIKHPMDLQTVATKLQAGQYETHDQFILDIRRTFDNAIQYNQADKDRGEETVYALAMHMKHLAEDLLGEMTLDVMEKLHRRKLNGDDWSTRKRPAPDDGGSAKKARKTESVKTPEKSPERKTKTPETKDAPESTAKKPVDDDVIVPRIKLNVSSAKGPAKAERKAEEKRRKRAKREEESQKRRRTAVAATDDAIREAERRSRRKRRRVEAEEAKRARQKQQQEEQERLQEEKRREKAKFDASKLSSIFQGGSFWCKKRTKLGVSPAFETPQVM